MFGRALRTAVALIAVHGIHGWPLLAAEPREGEPAAATPSSESAPSPTARAIEEIVVTARQREERLQDAPVAVTAISGDDLVRYDVTRLEEVAQMTPQLFVSEFPTGNGGTLTIRGIGSASTTGGFEQAVSIYLDGLQYSRGNVLSQGHFDLGQIEVLKGPQALFFGKNSSAGVVSITSADPGDELELVGRAGHEFRADESWGEAIASGPLTNDLSARLALRYGHLEGYIDNVAPATTDPGSSSPVPAPANPRWPGKNEFLGRLTLVWRPNDAFRLKMKVSGAHLDTVGASQPIETISCEAFGNASLDSAYPCRRDWKVRQNDAPPVIAAAEAPSGFDDEKGALYSRYHSYAIAIPATWDLGFGSLTSITGATHYDTQFLGDYDFTGTSVIFAVEDVFYDTVSEEMRFLTDFDVPVNFMVGGYFQKTGFGLRNIARVLPLPQDPTTGRYVTWDRPSETDGKTWSAFGQLIWNVTETVEIAAGARFTLETKDSVLVHDYIHPAALTVFRAPGDVLSDDFRDDNVSPEATVTWTPEWKAADLTLYVAHKQGFKSGGFSNSAIARPDTTPEDVVFDSETVSGFEGGVKSTWLDGALLVNLVGYGYEFKDLQVNFFDSASISHNVQNAAAATTTGMEAELRWLPPVDGFTLRGSFSHNRARYDEFLSFCYTGQSDAAGCNLDENGNPATGPGVRQDLAGTVREIAPEWTGAFGFLYERRLVQGLMLAVSADTSWTDRYLLSSLGRPDVVQSDFFRTDASLRLSALDEALEISFVGRNLSNEHVVPAAAVDSPLSGQGTGTSAGVLADQVGAVNRPRELGIQFTGRF